MSAVSKTTATDIALAWREIEVAEKLIEQISEELERRGEVDVRDAFGRPRNGLELGVPSGGGLRIFNVPWVLARPIIKTHIAQQHAIIALLTEKARIEIASSSADVAPVEEGGAA
jgi:hypothetical protein